MKPTPRDGILRGGRALGIRLLILVAAGVSGYLLSVSLSGGSAVGCGPGSACDEVLKSRGAYLLGIPVSALALVVDIALLLTTFSCGAKSTPKQRRGAWEIMVPCAVLVLGAALWFVALQAFVLHRFCPWCMTAHVSGALAAVLLLLRLPVTDAKERREKDPSVTRGTAVTFAAIALAAIAFMGVAQTFAPVKTYSVSVVPNAPTNPAPVMPDTNLAATKSALVPSNAPIAPRVDNVPSAKPTFDIFGGRIRLDLAQVPIWGSPDAPHKLISLYDYTCHHCREMHERVVEVQRSFGNKLAVISLPMPLDAQCNSLIRRTHPSQLNGCDYAKLGLAVWRAKRDALMAFDDWLFGFDKPPPLADVTNKVLQLIGTIAFDAARRDPWIEQQLRTDIDLYTISMREYGNGSMPQFLIGSNIFSGTLATEQLRKQVAVYVEPAAAK